MESKQVETPVVQGDQRYAWPSKSAASMTYEEWVVWHFYFLLSAGRSDGASTEGQLHRRGRK